MFHPLSSSIDVAFPLHSRPLAQSSPVHPTIDLCQVTELDGKKRLKPCAVALYTTKSLTINKGQSSMVLGASGENAEEDDAKDVD